jgi:PAS domain S-box-containing protein
VAVPTGGVDGETEGRNVSASISLPDGDYVPSEIVSTVFYSATVSDTLALVVAETVGGSQRLTWGNEGATQLLGYGLDDLRSLPVEQLFPTLGGGELKLLLRRERAARMTLPVRTASGEILESVVMTTPAPSGRMWTMRIISTANEHERALRATADAHERRFSALTERSPVPTLLSEQGMRLAHVNDAFCALVGLRAEQLLGTGWINTVHEDDLDGVIEQVAAALDGDEVETQARLVRAARSGRRSSGSPTSSPPASAPASSARSRTSPIGWPSRPSSPTRPTTTR